MEFSKLELTKKALIIGSLAGNYAKILFYNKDKIIFIKMSIGTKNWGDALNIPLVHNISGKIPVIAYPNNLQINEKPVYFVIGSILNSTSIQKNSIIWGSGFIKDTERIVDEPQKICAVRGPLTRELIIDSGFDCPKIFGDPALLYPLFYQPKIKKSYKLGIIPHYVDKNNPLLKKFENDNSVLIIDIRGGINKVIDNICSCNFIASSSLHGIIASDAYGIPSTWIKISDDVAGEGFKFRDYFESINREYDSPLVLKRSTTNQEILDTIEYPTIKINLKKLISACPFQREKF